MVRNRSHRVRTYPACFIGSEAVDTLQVAFQLPRHLCEIGAAHQQRLPDAPRRIGKPAAQTQLPIAPPSFLRIATMPERGRPPGV